MRFLSIILCFLSSIASAQSGLISAETLWIHKAIDEEEDISSNFPILKSPSKPGIAATINTALQMQYLGYVLNEKNKAALLAQGKVEKMWGDNLSFNVNRLTDRLIAIDIYRFHLNNAMSLNGWNDVKRFYFDAANGQPVSLREGLFNSKIVADQKNVLIPALKKDMIREMQVYESEFSEKDIPKLDEECECECSQRLDNAFCEGAVRLSYDESSKSFTFSMPDCDWMNPRSHTQYQASVASTVADTWLTPYGKYLIYGGTPQVNNPAFKMWKGTIDGKIALTFFLWMDNCSLKEGRGLEIYDRHGINIPLSVKIQPGNSLEIHELDSEGKILATISCKLEGGKLTGKWVKADGSKVLGFEAK